MFNKANKGKILITEENGEVQFWKKKPAAWLLKKQVKNPNFPYKKYVTCPHCDKYLFGSASRGKLGKYYPAYHCNKRGHYFRVPVKEFDQTIWSFVQNLKISSEYVEELKKYASELWNERIAETQEDSSVIDTKILELKVAAKASAEKIRYLTSEVAIKYMEEDIIKIEKEMREYEETKSQKVFKSPVNMEIVLNYVGYFLEHLEELLLGSSDPLKRAAYFGLIFDKAPNYQELLSGTPKLAPYLGLKQLLGTTLVPVGDPTGNRTPIYRLRTYRPNR